MRVCVMKMGCKGRADWSVSGSYTGRYTDMPIPVG